MSNCLITLAFLALSAGISVQTERSPTSVYLVRNFLEVMLTALAEWEREHNDHTQQILGIRYVPLGLISGGNSIIHSSLTGCIA